MKRILIFVGILILAVVGFFFYQFKTGGFTITLTEQQLQSQLQTKFPIERSLLLAKTSFTNPRVQLKEGANRIHFSADVIAQVPTQTPWKGAAEFSGGVRYDPESGQIYLTDAQIESLTLPGVPEKHLEQVKEFGSVAAKELLNRFPLYTLDPGDHRMSLARLVIRSVEVDGGSLRIVLGI